MGFLQERVEQILDFIFVNEDSGIKCGECYAQIEKFVEIELRGESPAETMPATGKHLRRCLECREEYKILLDSLRELEDSEGVSF